MFCIQTPGRAWEQETEAAVRRKAFADYQINENSWLWPREMSSSCTAFRRITAKKFQLDYWTARKSVVFDQAENRMHAQKAYWPGYSLKNNLFLRFSSQRKSILFSTAYIWSNT